MSNQVTCFLSESHQMSIVSKYFHYNSFLAWLLWILSCWVYWPSHSFGVAFNKMSVLQVLFIMEIWLRYESPSRHVCFFEAKMAMKKILMLSFQNGTSETNQPRPCCMWYQLYEAVTLCLEKYVSSTLFKWGRNRHFTMWTLDHFAL